LKVLDGSYARRGKTSFSAPTSNPREVSEMSGTIRPSPSPRSLNVGGEKDGTGEDRVFSLHTPLVDQKAAKPPKGKKLLSLDERTGKITTVSDRYFRELARAAGFLPKPRNPGNNAAPLQGPGGIGAEPVQNNPSAASPPPLPPVGPPPPL
jgi:hypothetical protein